MTSDAETSVSHLESGVGYKVDALTAPSQLIRSCV